MRKAKVKEGESFEMLSGGIAKIIKYNTYRNVTIEFEDSTIVHNIAVSDLKVGKVKNPNRVTVCGVGYFGIGLYKSKINKEVTKEYATWTAMLKRCYNNENFLRQPTYIGCEVAEEWHNFQNFAQWFTNNYIQGFQLDKDILVKGNKIYSPETCCFVPHEINSLFTKSNSIRGELPIGVRKSGKYFIANIKKGEKKSISLGTFKTPEEAFQAYKTEKEKYIKEVADKWKNQISPQVYRALYNYKVEITD